jgi:hypothetical protein
MATGRAVVRDTDQSPVHFHVQLTFGELIEIETLHAASLPRHSAGPQTAAEALTRTPRHRLERRGPYWPIPAG